MDSNLLLRLDLRSQPQAVAEITMTTLIIIAAIFGNSLVCVAVYKTRRLRTIPNVFIINLAVTDLLLVTTVLPVVIQTQATGAWSLGPAYCECQAFQSIYLFAVSLLTLTAISINRYFKIVKRQVYDAIFHRKSVKAIIVGIWIVAALLGMCPVVGWGRYKFEPKKALCSLDVHSSISFRNTVTAIMVVNMVTILACNLMVASAVRNHRRQLLPRIAPIQTGCEMGCRGGTQQGLGTGGNSCQTSQRANVTNARQVTGIGPCQTLGEDIHIARTVSLLVLLFFLSWLPNLILDNLVLAGVHVPYEVRMFGVYTMFMNSVINPAIYAVRNRMFRTAFGDMFRCG